MTQWERLTRTSTLLSFALGHEPADRMRFERALELGVNTQLFRYAQYKSWEIPKENAPIWRAHLTQVLMRRSVLVELVEGLDAARVPYAVLKGEPMSWLLYEDGFVRRTSDVDLLVRWADANRVSLCLRELGYVPQGDPRPMNDDEWAFVHRRTGQLVEVHWALAMPRIASPGVEGVLGRREYARIGDSSVPVLCAEDVGFVVLYHAHRHFGAYKGLLDAASWLDRFSSVGLWEKVYGRCCDLGVEAMAQWLVLCVGEETDRCWRGVADPLAVFWADFFRSRVRGVFAREEEIMGNDAMSFKTKDTSAMEALLWQMAGMSLMDGWGQKIRGSAQVVEDGWRAWGMKSALEKGVDA